MRRFTLREKLVFPHDHARRSFRMSDSPQISATLRQMASGRGLAGGRTVVPSFAISRKVTHEQQRHRALSGGRLLKGVGLNVDPARATFHIRSDERRAVDIRLDEIKALFFVRSLEGDRDHLEVRTPVADDPRARRRNDRVDAIQRLRSDGRDDDQLSTEPSVLLHRSGGSDEQ